MSETYLALVDPTAEPSNAQGRADRILETFIARGILSGEKSTECVYGGEGYLPGPVLNACYQRGEHELCYWDMLTTCGVRFIAKKWVNMFGFIVFEYSQCPGCGSRFGEDSDFMRPLGEAAGDFYNRDGPSMLLCPDCEEAYDIRNWITEPHLGLCHLAIEFWNWPDFSRENWRISIPRIASEAIGQPLITTHGRM